MISRRTWGYLAKKGVVDSVVKNKHLFREPLLDLGCGNKPYKEYFEVDKYVGLDKVENLGAEVVGDMQKLPFGENTFRTVVSVDSLDDVPQPELVLKEVERVLMRGGVLFLVTPQSAELGANYDYYRFTKNGLRYLLEKNKFTILSMSERGGVFVLIFLSISWFLYRLTTSWKWLKYVFSPGVWLGSYLAEALDCMDRSKRNTLGHITIARVNKNK